MFSLPFRTSSYFTPFLTSFSYNTLLFLPPLCTLILKACLSKMEGFTIEAAAVSIV